MSINPIEPRLSISDKVCFACGGRIVALRKTYPSSDREDATMVRTQNTTQVCVNKRCWRYIQLPVKTWESVDPSMVKISRTTPEIDE